MNSDVKGLARERGTVVSSFPATSRKIFKSDRKFKLTYYAPQGAVGAGGAGGANKATLEKFDTGGYTGSWGPEGKLATLHEKELVLNKHDTENMLSAVEIVRDINNQIENSAKYFGGIGANIHLPSISDMSQILEQTVHIDANFPGVKDRFEIEQAFENIVNMASQFANRKKM